MLHRFIIGLVLRDYQWTRELTDDERRELVDSIEVGRFRDGGSWETGIRSHRLCAHFSDWQVAGLIAEIERLSEVFGRLEEEEERRRMIRRLVWRQYFERRRRDWRAAGRPPLDEWLEAQRGGL